MDERVVNQAFVASQVEIINVHLFYPDVPRQKVANPDQKYAVTCLGHNTGPLREAEKLEELEAERLRLEAEMTSQTLRDAEDGLKEHFRGYLETADNILDSTVAKCIADTKLCLKNGSPQKALDYLARAINLRPQNASLYELRAEICFRLQDYTSAIKNYKRALKLDSTLRPIASGKVKPDKNEIVDEDYFIRSEKSVISGDHFFLSRSNTMHDYDYMAMERSNNLSNQRLSLFYFMYAQSLFDVKRYVEALEAYSNAVSLVPDCIFYHVACLSCLVSMRRTNEALSVANRLIEDGYQTADMFLLRARLLRLFKNYTASFMDVQSALKLQPDHSVAIALSEEQREEARRNVAIADELTIKQRYKEALQHISLAIEMEPSVLEYHLKRGIIYRHLQEHNAAIDSFMTAMSRTDSAAAELASVKVPRAVQPENRQHSMTVISIPGEKSVLGSENQPNNTRALVPVSKGDAEKQNSSVSAAGDKVAHDMQIALLAQRQLVLTYSDFAVACLQKGFCNEGILLLNKAIKVEKREKGLYVNRGDCFFKLQDYDFALADYEQALELDPYDTEIRRRIAVLYSDRARLLLAQNKVGEAISLLNKGIEFSPLEASLYAMRANAHYSQQSLVSAQQDTVLALLMDPVNDKLIDFAIKLFNKQSVMDVLQGKVGEQMKVKYKELVTGQRQQLVPAEKREEPASESGGKDAKDDVRQPESAFAIAKVYQPVPARELRATSATIVNRLTHELASTVRIEQDNEEEEESELESESDDPGASEHGQTALQPTEDAQAADANASDSKPVEEKKPKKKRRTKRAESVSSDVLLVMRKKKIEERIKQQYLERGNLWQKGPRIIPAEAASDALALKPKQPTTGWRKFSRGMKAL